LCKTEFQTIFKLQHMSIQIQKEKKSFKKFKHSAFFSLRLQSSY